MRQIDPKEKRLIAFLALAGGVQLSLPARQRVWVVNQEMGSIRADYCPAGCRVLSVASHEFEDDDEVPIIASLLLTEDGRFGELDFWKINDEPIISWPVAPSL
ncbi:DUF6984 family protein [Notoacmeibacter ruber]|uniref:DUF6984 domain-containing protein n=1 Tax=Notoacmeibacter ruber TaxID=2670375 RepID=A0A3L7J9E1_9HYPH|nr:hypothetical protein [Notoacmeibacter ruber]RLQ87358.1 hypothetical protein D8780_03175 [Notoacmeibacter ruber]